MTNKHGNFDKIMGDLSKVTKAATMTIEEQRHKEIMGINRLRALDIKVYDVRTETPRDKVDGFIVFNKAMEKPLAVDSYNHKLKIWTLWTGILKTNTYWHHDYPFYMEKSDLCKMVRLVDVLVNEE